MSDYFIAAGVASAFFAYITYQLIVWRTYDETWAWVHQRNRLTGDVRHIQKVRGVPMTPPTRPEGIPPPPRPGR